VSARDVATGPEAGGRAGRDWDASTYDRVSAPQQAWAREQLERLHLEGDEVVLDAGCGSGRVTSLLRELVPAGRVYAVDAAPSMVEHARAALARVEGPPVTVLCQDLVELELPEPVDVVFSNATFHWIHDHERLFARLYAALRPGGRLLAQCGGAGNIDRFRRVADELTREPPFSAYEFPRPWNYATAEETAQRLRAAGFEEVRTWLQERPTPLEDPRPFVTTVCVLPYLEQLPEELREPFVDAVLARSGRPFVLDYVRLNISATRPS
jgi:trans-aconitate 2-methyltransferase